jgi:hypothetical protein
MATESLVSDIPAGDENSEHIAFLPFKTAKPMIICIYKQSSIHCYFLFFCRGFRATQATGPTPITIRDSEFMNVILLPTKTEFEIDFSNNKELIVLETWSML